MHVFPSTDGLEVFVNEGGSITMKQVDASRMDEAIIIIPLQHVTATCKALRQAAKEARED